MGSDSEDIGALRASEERFRKLVEGAPDGVVICRDEIVVYSNDLGAKLLGYEQAQDFCGQPMSSFLDASSLGAMRRRIQRMADSGERLAPREYPAKRRDGVVITVEISSILLEYDGAPAVLAYARDVTERARLRAQLEHADRLAALGRLAAGVAHEINNPLAFMTLAASSLNRKLLAAGADEDVQALVEDIQLGVMRIAAVTRDLRVFGRYEEDTPGTVDLAQVLAQSARLAGHELRARVQLRIEHDLLPAVRGVGTRLEQVFVNLLLNAAHAVSDERTDGLIVVRARVVAEAVVVEVEDNGMGIGPEALPRVFDPFFTTRASGSGTGLGLSICRDILSRIGGDLEAESELGRGTTMRVTLPVWSADEASRCSPNASVGEAAAPTSTATSARRRILVIDDEPLVASMVSDTLGEAHEVVVETLPAAALERLLVDPQFDLVLCDLMMPAITGMDLYERMARDRPGMEQRFVFFTGGAFTGRARTFLETVHNERLMKPFSPSELESLVAAATRGR